MPTAPSESTGGRLPPEDRARPGRSGPNRRPGLVSDLRRFWVASAVSTGLAVTYVAIVVVVEPGRVVALPFLATTYFGAWVGYALSYVLLTWRTLGRADGSTLRSWLGESRTGRRRRRRAESLAGIGGPAGAVSFCLLALAAVIVATVVPQLRGDPVVLPLAVAVVVTTWVLIVIVFAVHYAREDAQFGGLRFGGGTDLASDQASSPPRFADYVFLAVQISTSYTSADVTVTGPGLRRATITQTLVSFVFNSILIALVVSLITLNAH